MLSEEDVRRQRDLFEGFGLPTDYGPEVDTAAVSEAMRSDKKTSGRTSGWVLLDGIGAAVTRNDVPNELVRETLLRLDVEAPPDPQSGARYDVAYLGDNWLTP